MWNMVYNNLLLVGALAAVLLGVVIANILFGLYGNIGLKHEDFDWRKLLRGIAKGAVVIVGTACLTVCFTILPYILDIIKISIDAEVIEAVSVIALFAVYVWAIVQYGKRAVEKLKVILKVSKIDSNAIEKKRGN